MARGLYAFLGGAFKRAREMGTAQNEAYQGMLEQAMEEDKRRREEEQLRLNWARLNQPDSPIFREDPSGNTMMWDAEQNQFVPAPGVPEKPAKPDKPAAPIFREGADGSTMMWDATKGAFVPAPGAPAATGTGPRRTPTQQKADEALLAKREYEVGQIPSERISSAENELAKVYDEARKFTGKGDFSTMEQVMAAINGNPALKRRYDRATARLEEAYSGAGAAAAPKAGASDDDILKAMGIR